MNLGVDESNHRRYPEIFVGCYSKDADAIKRGNLPKHRKTGHRPFYDYEYRHLRLEETHAQLIHPRYFIVIATSELVRYLEQTNRVEKVFVDGRLKEDQKAALEERLHALRHTIRLLEHKGLDRRIPLVNEADNWANRLHRYYSQPQDTPKNKYVDTLVTARLEDYPELFIS